MIRWEIQRWYILNILHETGFPCEKFSTAYFIDGLVVFRIFTFYIVFNYFFWIDWVRMHKYMNIKGLDSRAITSSSKSKSVMSMACHFCFRWKKTYAPHKTHLHTTWIIERLDRKLVDVISYNTWKSVTSHYLEPFNLLHPMFCTC